MAVKDSHSILSSDTSEPQKISINFITVWSRFGFYISIIIEW